MSFTNGELFRIEMRSGIYQVWQSAKQRAQKINIISERFLTINLI